MHVSIISSLVQQCYAPRLVAVTKFKTTKINFEGFFGLSTKISTHENHPPYGSSCPHTLATHKALCEEIVATLEKKPHACMNTIKWVWSWLQAMIAYEWLLIWGENMTEDILPLICCLFSNRISTIRKAVLKTNLHVNAKCVSVLGEHTWILQMCCKIWGISETHVLQ